MPTNPGFFWENLAVQWTSRQGKGGRWFARKIFRVNCHPAGRKVGLRISRTAGEARVNYEPTLVYRGRLWVAETLPSASNELLLRLSEIGRLR
jgi:hypothetical protein